MPSRGQILRSECDFFGRDAVDFRDVNLRFKDWNTRLQLLQALIKRLVESAEAFGVDLPGLIQIVWGLDLSCGYAVLLIFQGMDAAGKDGAIRNVMSGVNPQGCQVFSFKQPSSEELEHDFLWRTTKRLPERGRIGIFNRSYYEEVLIVRVHPEILRSQGLPAGLIANQAIWKERYRSIVDFEAHLHRNGTRLIKIFLHQSQDEQRKRFLKRIDDPDNRAFTRRDNVSTGHRRRCGADTRNPS